MTFIIDKPEEFTRGSEVKEWLEKLLNMPDGQVMGEPFDTLDDMMRGKAKFHQRFKNAKLTGKYRMLERKVNNQYVLYIFRKL